MNNRWKTALPLLGILLLASPEARSQIVPQTTVTGSGAVHATNGTYRINATLGQPVTGHVQAHATTTEQGFWYALPRTAGTTAAPEEPTAGANLLTLQASPNPFSESTQLTLRIPNRGHVTVTLHDLLGQPVRTLLDAEQPEGSLTVHVPADDLTSGQYTAVLKAGRETRSISLTILK